MHVSRSNSGFSIWVLLALLGGAGVVLAALGPARSDDRTSNGSPSATLHNGLTVEEVLSSMMGPASEESADPPSKPNPPPVRPLPRETGAQPPRTPNPLPDQPPAKDKPKEQLYQAEFMGTVAKGQRFCIIADASNSMRGAQLAQLKKELIKTLEGLDPACQFYIIFFHQTDLPMPFPNWLDATKENIEKVKPWIMGMNTKLRTLPQSAFTRAFKLNPKPDVIFFMTDGFLQGKPDAISHVSKLNSGEPKVIVHTIMFTKKKVDVPRNGAANQLRTLAEKNGGTYRHVKSKND